MTTGRKIVWFIRVLLWMAFSLMLGACIGLKVTTWQYRSVIGGTFVLVIAYLDGWEAVFG